MRLCDIKNIILIGSMGCGKSSIGRFLAKKLGVNFIDTDYEIEKKYNTSISCIFEKEGETGFRKYERAFINGLKTVKNSIISTGGGAILDQQNRQVLLSLGVIVYLNIDLKYILKRISSHNRPLLKQTDAEAKLKELQRERHPIYSEMADICITSKNQEKVYKMAEIIMQTLVDCSHNIKDR